MKKKEEKRIIYSDPNSLKVGGTMFLTEKFDYLDSRDYRLSHRWPPNIFNHLRRKIVRYNTKHDLGLYERFWKRGYLASSKSLRDLAYDFGYSGLTQIRSAVSHFVKRKEIYIADVNVGKAKPQHVYILGIHNGRPQNYEELLFTELRFSINLKDNFDDYLTEFGVDKKLIKW